MGQKADHDLWGQALAFECHYGDRAPDVIAANIEQLRKAGELAEADFLSDVADCLTQLHAIKGATNVRPRRASDPIRTKTPAPRPRV